jgi:hypothetical protein
MGRHPNSRRRAVSANGDANGDNFRGGSFSETVANAKNHLSRDQFRVVTGKKADESRRMLRLAGALLYLKRLISCRRPARRSLKP